MIKVFYDGLGITKPSEKRAYTTSSGIACPVNEYFYISESDARSFKHLEKAKISVLFYADEIDDYPSKFTSLLYLTDKEGNPASITIAKDKTIYPPEENNGNALRIFFDDDPPDNEKPLTENERATLYKLIHFMMVDKYGYDPLKQRNESTGNNKNSVSNRLKTHGFDITNRTIQEIMKKAKKYVR